jgi:hypothetical protein
MELSKHSSNTSLSSTPDHDITPAQSPSLNVDIEKQAGLVEINTPIQTKDEVHLQRVGSHISTSHDMPPVDPFKEHGDEIYSRFSEKKKKIMTAVLSFTAVLAPLSSTTVLSAVPEVAKQFSTSGDIVNLSNALYLVSMGLSRELSSLLMTVLTNIFSLVLWPDWTSIRSTMGKLSDHSKRRLTITALCDFRHHVLCIFGRDCIVAQSRGFFHISYPYCIPRHFISHHWVQLHCRHI